jgi:anti-sigma factor ChrR (cupin superfamily)
MTRPIHDEELAELALGTLTPAHRDALVRDLGADAVAVAEADAAEALSALAVALPPAAPSPGLRDRLLASARGPARFAPFIDRLARLCDLAVDRAQALLASLSDPATWQASPGPNISLVHFDGGPRVAAADAGFVRVAAGTPFPDHRHVGEETVLVLQGSFIDSHGTEVRAGDIARMSTDSRHHFMAGAGEDLIYAAVVFGGIEIEGIPPELLRPPRTT